MKKLILILLVAVATVSCGSIRKGGTSGGEVTGVGASVFNETTPFGMVLVDVGSMREGPNERDSVWGIDSTAHGISVDAFWMDEMEVSNSKYKQFVYWVRDSIIRERLADPAYGGNEEFKIEEDKEGKRFEGTYVDDMRDGRFVEKDRNGKVIATGIYNRGYRQEDKK